MPMIAFRDSAEREMLEVIGSAESKASGDGCLVKIDESHQCFANDTTG